MLQHNRSGGGCMMLALQSFQMPKQSFAVLSSVALDAVCPEIDSSSHMLSKTLKFELLRGINHKT